MKTAFSRLFRAKKRQKTDKNSVKKEQIPLLQQKSAKMILPYKTYGVLTAGELRKKLTGVPNDTPVYVSVDQSDDNFDENGRLILVHPIESVEREYTSDDQGFDTSNNMALIMHLAEDFYDKFDCKFNNTK